MSIPQVDISAVSDGCIGVLTALTSAQQTMGNTKLAFFLDVVPERGSELWDRFRAFQKQYADSSFTDFMKSVMALNPVKLFYPKGCTLDAMTCSLLASEIAGALSPVIKNDDEVLGIHFAVGPAFEVMQRVACKGCHMSKCPHFAKFKGGRR